MLRKLLKRPTMTSEQLDKAEARWQERLYQKSLTHSSPCSHIMSDRVEAEYEAQQRKGKDEQAIPQDPVLSLRSGELGLIQQEVKEDAAVMPPPPARIPLGLLMDDTRRPTSSSAMSEPDPSLSRPSRSRKLRPSHSRSTPCSRTFS